MLTKNYHIELRRFISSRHLSAGVLVTACVIIPAVVLYRFDLLTSMISIPLGALFVGLTDNPGPVHQRRNGLLISSGVNFMIILIAGISNNNPWLIGVEILLLGVVSSIISVYGTRAASIGLTALIIFLLSIDPQFSPANYLERSVYYLAGGLLYTVVSLSFTTLKPYRPVQQLLGECLMGTASYLVTKARFYDRKADTNDIINKLIEQQVSIHQYQEQLRTLLFTTRRFISESTVKGRILTMMFRDSIDLFERAITAQHDYELLHREFDDSGVLAIFHDSILSMAHTLYHTGLAVQEGAVYRSEKALQLAADKSRQSFENLRKEKLNSANLESFIILRRVYNSVVELAEHIKRIQVYTTYDKRLTGDLEQDVDFTKFSSRQTMNLQLIYSNLSFQSSAFRHAIRLTCALLVGYSISLFFPLGHGYWILLTIATIIKPAFGLTRQRNFQRLGGTFAGVLVGFIILYFFSADAVIFVAMIIMMITAYSLLRINYAVSIGSLTVYLVLSFHFLYPSGLNAFLFDRVIDTIIGSVIAYLVSYFVLPVWEYHQIEKIMMASLRAARTYFITVAGSFVNDVVDITAYKIARKDAFVNLANLSDAFQRMLSDPKNQQPNLPLYQQFVAAQHVLISHIATLSNYGRNFASAYRHPDFKPLIKTVDSAFSTDGKAGPQDESLLKEKWQSSPILKKVRQLIDQRKNDLGQGLETTPAETRKMLNELVTVTDQMKFIYSTAKEVVKIANEIRVQKV